MTDKMIDFLLCCAFVVVTGALVYIAATAVTGHRENREVRFEQTCAAKGGLTLQAIKDGERWIGCYRGVVELENEQH